MKCHTKKALKWVINHKVLGVVILATIGLLGWWLVATYMTHPLGSKMEYLGKEDYGNIFGFDSRPASIYYYGTDLSVEDIEEYFGGQVIDRSYDKAYGIDFTIKFPSGETMYSSLMPPGQTKFQTSKKYVLDVPSFKYSIIRKYMNQK